MSAITDVCTEYTYFISASTEGYSGVALYSRVKPHNVTYGIGDKKHDSEGRTITAEYENYYVVTACEY